MKRLPILLYFLIALTGPAHAGEAPSAPTAGPRYELIKGKGVEVCEAYGKNLNSFHQAEPMRCERSIDAEFKDFSKPEWKRIDGLASYPLVESAHELLERPSGISRKAELDGLKENIRAQNEPYTFSIAKVDINNDGKPEPILRYFDTCIPLGTKGRYGIPLLALTADGKAVDSEKTEHLMQNPGHDKGPGHPVGRWTYAMYDIFLYKRVAYFDRWSDSTDETGILRVFKTQNGATKEICRYRYVNE